MKEYKMGIFNNVGRFLNLNIRDCEKNFNEQIQGGLKLDVNNNYDIEGKRLANVGQGVENHDATNMSQLSQLRSDSLQVDGSSHMTGDLDLRGNKLILPGEINMNRKLIKNLDVDENDDLSAVNIYLFIYLFNFIYTRVKTSGLKGNTKITLIILSKYLSTTKLNLMTVKK